MAGIGNRKVRTAPPKTAAAKTAAVKTAAAKAAGVEAAAEVMTVAPSRPEAPPSAYQLERRRAPALRSFVAPAFFAGPDVGEGDPKGLTLLELTASPKLGELAQRVYADLKDQFSEEAEGREETDATRIYRQKLESWAVILETMLEETLNELETLRSGGAVVIPGGIQAFKGQTAWGAGAAGVEIAAPEGRAK